MMCTICKEVVGLAGILIVDDQEIVRAGMKKMIQEMEVDFGGIYEASNGAEAIGLAMVNSPDIMLVDIMMPVLDGFLMIEELKKNNIGSHIIIISAFNDFDFAKKAINFKVDDYILKPVSKKMLYEVLMSAKKNIQMDMEQAEKMKEKDHRYFFMLLYEYLTGNDIFINIDELFACIGKVFTYGFYKIAILCFDNADDEVRQRIKKDADTALDSEDSSHISFMDGSGRLIYIYNFKCAENNSDTVFPLKNGVASKDDVNIGISLAMEELQSLRELYRQADIALKESIFRKCLFCTYNDIKKSQKPVLNINAYSMFVDLLSLGDKSGLDGMLQELFVKMAKESFCFSDMEHTLLNLINYIYIHLKDLYPGLPDAETSRVKLRNAKNMFSMKIIIKNIIDDFSGYIREYGMKDNSGRVVDYIIRNIKSNYNKDISLTQISNELSMNYCYVSNVFALKTGKTFSEYLMQVRLEKAKELLVNGNDKIFEVAEKSGYADSKYFCKLFKKQFNLSPVEYREKNFVKSDGVWK